MKKCKHLFLFAGLVIFLAIGCGNHEEEKPAPGNEPQKPSDSKTDEAKDASSDGDKIDSVNINGQVWMAKNMATDQATDGTSVTCYADTNTDADFVKHYGCLYTFADAIKVCPQGWHLPTKTDFINLLAYAGYEDITDPVAPDPAFLALAAKNPVWADYGELITNNTGFGALPAGYYVDGLHLNFGSDAYFWAATEYERDTNSADNLSLTGATGGGDAYVDNSPKSYAFSVRCIKNAP